MRNVVVVVLAALWACSGNVHFEDSSGGKTTSSGTTSSGTTSSSTSSTGDPVVCKALEDAYATVIGSALGCNPALNAMQCTLKIPSDLVCQCNVFANPDNTTLIKTLAGYLDTYKIENCDPGIDCDCAEPTSGSCEPDSDSGGSCVSKY